MKEALKHMIVFLVLQRRVLKFLFVYFCIFSLTACGVKSAPSAFDNQPIDKKTEAPKEAPKEAPNSTIRSNSPYGFPLEYPNRPSY